MGARGPTNPSRVLPVLTGVLTALVLVGASLFVPFDARHSAPFGFSLTADFERLIAVPGGWVTANYPNFDRVDLDLRAYSPGATYDLTVSVRPEGEGEAPIHTVRLLLDYEEIRHDKPTFANPFLTIRFPAVADSTGKRYYVWVEKGPRNRDEIVTLWSVKSYSRVTGRDVVAALLDDPPGESAEGLVRVVLVAALGLLVGGFGWLVGAATAVAMRLGRGTKVEISPERVSLADVAAAGG